MHSSRLHNLLIKGIANRIVRLSSNRIRLSTLTTFLRTFSSTRCQLRTNHRCNARLVSSISIIFKVMLTTFKVPSSSMQTTRIHSRIDKSVSNRHALYNRQRNLHTMTSLRLINFSRRLSTTRQHRQQRRNCFTTKMIRTYIAGRPCRFLRRVHNLGVIRIRLPVTHRRQST